MSRAQKRSLTCRTTKEVMDDQQWVLQSKLGMTRARAIGILMDDHGEFSDVDEVHVILGPKNDIKLKINSIECLESNSRAEICYEEVIPHVPGQYGRRDNVMCITMPIELKDRRFIMDSGSGHDLISSTRVDRMDIDTCQSDRVNFHTANGITSTSTHSMNLLGLMCWRTPHLFCHWENDAWSKVTLLYGLMEENPT